MDNATGKHSYIQGYGMKGISPVIAVILMVMITVALVAFSYSWLQGTLSQTQQQTTEVLTQTEKMNQRVDVTTAYQCGNDICFELKAASTNRYSLDMNGTGYYVNGVPKTASTWDGGIGGAQCTTVTTLAAGGRCYGKIAGTSCKIGDIFKVSLAWGTERTKGIDNCS